MKLDLLYILWKDNDLSTKKILQNLSRKITQFSVKLRLRAGNHLYRSLVAYAQSLKCIYTYHPHLYLVYLLGNIKNY